jgi:hypothetical protein
MCDLVDHYLSSSPAKVVKKSLLLDFIVGDMSCGAPLILDSKVNGVQDNNCKLSGTFWGSEQDIVKLIIRSDLKGNEIG